MIEEEKEEDKGGRKRNAKDKPTDLIEAHLEQVYSDSLLMFGLSAAKLTLTSPHLFHSSLLSFSSALHPPP